MSFRSNEYCEVETNEQFAVDLDDDLERHILSTQYCEVETGDSCAVDLDDDLERHIFSAAELEGTVWRSGARDNLNFVRDDCEDEPPNGIASHEAKFMLTGARWRRNVKVALLFLAMLGVMAIGLHLAPNAGTDSIQQVAGGPTFGVVEFVKTCHSFTCHSHHLKGFYKEHRPFLKPQSWLINCSAQGCTHEQCCHQSCSSHQCPANMKYPKVLNHFINCGLNPGGCTDEYCCHTHEETCWDSACPIHWKPKPKRWELPCPNVKKESAHNAGSRLKPFIGMEHNFSSDHAWPLKCNRDLCCERIPLTCMNSSCPHGFAFKPEYWHIRCPGEGRAAKCSTSLCCNKILNCSQYTCPNHFGFNANRWDIVCKDGACDMDQCCHAMHPFWAHKGLKVQTDKGKTGTITSEKPWTIEWDDGTKTSPVESWHHIIDAYPPWCQLGMRVQDHTLKTGTVVRLHPWWKVKWDDGSKTSPIKQWSAHFMGIVQEPPFWAVEHVEVVTPSADGDSFDKGVITKMPRATILWANGTKQHPVYYWKDISQAPPPWAALGVQVVSQNGTTGVITSMSPPAIMIEWADGKKTNVSFWHGIAEAPPPWARKGMEVQDASLRLGNISVLRPLWRIGWADGTETDPARNWSASWAGIVQKPPLWAAVGVKLVGADSHTGVIISMPRAGIQWENGTREMPVPCWDGTKWTGKTATTTRASPSQAPPWAAVGVKVVSKNGKTGVISSVSPDAVVIKWDDGKKQTVKSWDGIAEAPPPWARNGMQVQDASGRTGNITKLHPLWRIGWSDGSTTDAAQNPSATWTGIVPKPPAWAAIDICVVGAHDKKGVIISMPRAGIEWEDGTREMPVLSWHGITWTRCKTTTVSGTTTTSTTTTTTTTMTTTTEILKLGHRLPHPPWAAVGVKVVNKDGETGVIVKMSPTTAVITWKDGKNQTVKSHRKRHNQTDKEADAWRGIAEAPPPWAKKGMQVQDASGRTGTIVTLHPLWSISWNDGGKTDSAKDRSASWAGIVQGPPAWAAVGVHVIGPNHEKGVITSMPRAGIEWADGKREMPVTSWDGVDWAGKTAKATTTNSPRPHIIYRTKTVTKTVKAAPEAAPAPAPAPVVYKVSAKSDVQIACFLLATVIFIMLLFSIVNFEADDIRRYAWNIIAGVASIFMAYLLFSTVHGHVITFGKDWGFMSCLVQYVWYALWAFVGLFVSAVVSGVLFEGMDHKLDQEVWVKADYLRSDYGYPINNSRHVRPSEGARSICVIQGVEVPVERKKLHLERRQQNLKCWGMLFSHIAGFAAVSAGNMLQHYGPFSSNPVFALFPVLINQVAISAMYCAFNNWGKPQQPGDPRVRMYGEEISASEVDVSGLAFSFLLVQVLRFKLSGKLPSLFGDVEESPTYMPMYICGLILFVLSFVVVNVKSYVIPPQEEDLTALGRFLAILSASFGMCFAWCSFYASSMLLQSFTTLKEHGVTMDNVIGRCLLALLLSIACMVIIWVMSAIERLCQRFMKFMPYGADIVHRIVTAMSILIGFAWVSAVIEAGDVVAKITPRPSLTVTLLVAFVLFLMLPAWQKYIVPKTMILHAYHLRKLAGESHGQQTGLA